MSRNSQTVFNLANCTVIPFLHTHSAQCPGRVCAFFAIQRKFEQVRPKFKAEIISTPEMKTKESCFSNSRKIVWKSRMNIYFIGSIISNDLMQLEWLTCLESSCASAHGHEDLVVAGDLNAGSLTHGLFDDFFYLPTFDVSLDRDEMGHCFKLYEYDHFHERKLRA